MLDHKLLGSCLCRWRVNRKLAAYSAVHLLEYAFPLVVGNRKICDPHAVIVSTNKGWGELQGLAIYNMSYLVSMIHNLGSITWRRAFFPSVVLIIFIIYHLMCHSSTDGPYLPACINANVTTSFLRTVCSAAAA